MSEIYGLQAFSPREISQKIREVGVTKAELPLLSMSMLGVLAGAFIGLGAMAFVLVKADPTLGFANSQFLAGLVFSLGLVLVIVAGAELFTGNNLLAMAWADGSITSKALLRNWFIVCLANLVGGVGLSLLVFLSGHTEMNAGVVADQYLRIANAKCLLTFQEAFFRGVLCNVLVCMAVWMAMAGRSVTDKILAVIFPITAFVAAGFEHSAANMYLIPMALLIKAFGVSSVAAEAVTFGNFIGNLVPVILGNLVGGSVLVALVYHVIYQRQPKD